MTKVDTSASAVVYLIDTFSICHRMKFYTSLVGVSLGPLRSDTSSNLYAPTISYKAGLQTISLLFIPVYSPAHCYVRSGTSGKVEYV